jgi:hypothetical protein
MKFELGQVGGGVQIIYNTTLRVLVLCISRTRKNCEKLI